MPMIGGSIGKSQSSNNNDLQTTQPLNYNEHLKIYEINLHQKEDSKWTQILVLMAKGDYTSATYNAEKMLEYRKTTIEEQKKREYSTSTALNGQGLNLKDIYGLVCEGLLLAKCKLISNYISIINTSIYRE